MPPNENSAPQAGGDRVEHTDDGIEYSCGSNGAHTQALDGSWQPGSEHDRGEVARLRDCAARRLLRQRQVGAIHNRGPRVVFELLDELDRHHGLNDDLDQRLAKYAEIDPAALTATGGDRFPPLPIREVP